LLGNHIQGTREKLRADVLLRRALVRAPAALPEVSRCRPNRGDRPQAASAVEAASLGQTRNEVEWRMSTVFNPRLDILPTAQKTLWPELAQTPDSFTLYRGTAIALHLGHRQSVDFDFFSQAAFEPRSLLQAIPYLKGAVVRKSAANNLAVTVDRGDPVQLSFFGDLGLGQVAPDELADGPGLKVAALVDLAGMKAAVVTQRAELRDHLDIHALLTKARISLPTMLAAAAIIYGPEFNPLLTLKAVSYHDDLAALPENDGRDLIEAVRNTNPQKLPRLDATRTREIAP
jgi:hypothetical protein